MKTVVGIFASREQAEAAVSRLRETARFPVERVNLLMPSSSEAAIHSGVATTETEQPGMGKAVGGVVGGVAGATAGMGLGTAVASLLVPGVGPVMAVGLAAAALFGAGGAVGGAAAGGALENSMSRGLPRDELYLYEDALRHGRSVVFALADSKEDEEAARDIFARAGAESLDAAREKWWIGLRDTEKEHYDAAEEPMFRKGFEAALHPTTRGKSFEKALEELERRHPEVSRHEAFRRGYERGLSHAERVRRRSA